MERSEMRFGYLRRSIIFDLGASAKTVATCLVTPACARLGFPPPPPPYTLVTTPTTLPAQTAAGSLDVELLTHVSVRWKLSPCSGHSRLQHMSPHPITTPDVVGCRVLATRHVSHKGERAARSSPITLPHPRDLPPLPGCVSTCCPLLRVKNTG